MNSSLHVKEELWIEKVIFSFWCLMNKEIEDREVSYALSTCCVPSLDKAEETVRCFYL